jgi:hypothetical protein
MPIERVLVADAPHLAVFGVAVVLINPRIRNMRLLTAKFLNAYCVLTRASDSALTVKRNYSGRSILKQSIKLLNNFIGDTFPRSKL